MKARRRYRIYRFFFNDHQREVIKEGLTLEEARQHCRDPETSSSTCTSEEGLKLTKEKGPWFDGYQEES